MATAENRCEHFSVQVGSFALPRDWNRARVPVETCDVCSAFVGRMDEAMPPQVYGPDGRLVTRETCTRERFERSCATFTRQQAPLHRRWRGQAHALGVRARAESHRLCRQSSELRERAGAALSRVDSLIARAQAAVQRSMRVAERQRPAHALAA